MTFRDGDLRTQEEKEKEQIAEEERQVRARLERERQYETGRKATQSLAEAVLGPKGWDKQPTQPDYALRTPEALRR